MPEPTEASPHAEVMRAFEMAALLGLVEQGATDILTLTENLDPDELLRTRLTRGEVMRRLRQIGACLLELEADGRERLPELDWAGWRTLGALLDGREGVQRDEAITFACSSLVPATLLWLRVHRQSQPELFRLALPSTT